MLAIWYLKFIYLFMHVRISNELLTLWCNVLKCDDVDYDDDDEQTNRN